MKIMLFIPFLALGEYRVYQYIQNNNMENLLRSTLNPVAYKAYNPMPQVDLIRTWICPGDTSHKKELCPSPYEAVDGEDIE